MDDTSSITDNTTLLVVVGGGFDDVLRSCSTRRVDLQEGDGGRLVAAVAYLQGRLQRRRTVYSTRVRLTVASIYITYK